MNETNSPGFGSSSQVLSAGVLSANIMSLGSDIAALEKAGIQLLHFDVMDGRFAPGLTFGAPFVKGIKTSMYKDVHLMIEDPLSQIEEFVAAGADMITVHVESDRHIHRVLQRIAECENVNDPSRGISRGVGINPGTPVASIEPFLDEIEVVFLIAVNPGFPGQKFIETTRKKFEDLTKLIEVSGKSILIGIDGGVTKKNIGEIAALGPDIIVTGSAIFENSAIEKNIRELSAGLDM